MNNYEEGTYIRGYETYYNGAKKRFLWSVKKDIGDSVLVKKYVLAESNNVKTKQLPIGYSFESYVAKRTIEKLIKSGDAEFVPFERTLCSACSLLHTYDCHKDRCILK